MNFLLALVAIFIITLVNGMENMGHRRIIRTERMQPDDNDLENALKSYLLGPRSSNVGIKKQYNEVKCFCVPHAVSRRTLSVDKQINEIDNKLKEIRMEGHGANEDLIKELEDKMYALIMNGAGRRQIVGNANDVKCSCVKNLPGYQKMPHAALRMSDSVEQKADEIYNKLSEILVQSGDVSNVEVKELENKMHALIMEGAGRRAERRSDSVDGEINEIVNKLFELHIKEDNPNPAEIKKLQDKLLAVITKGAGRRHVAHRRTNSVIQQIDEIYNKLIKILMKGGNANDVEVRKLQNKLYTLIMKGAERRAWRRTDSVDPQIDEILNKLIDLHLEGENANNAEIKKLEDILMALVMNDAGRRNSKKGDYASDVQIIPFDVKEIAKKNLPRRDFK